MKKDPVGSEVLFISLPNQHFSVCLPLLVGTFEVTDNLSYTSRIRSSQKPIPDTELSNVRSDDVWRLFINLGTKSNQFSLTL